MGRQMADTTEPDDLNWLFDPNATEALLDEHRRNLDRWIERNWNRREMLNRECPHCPRCGTRQVQLIDNCQPAQWKCRSCKRRFEYEP